MSLRDSVVLDQFVRQKDIAGGGGTGTDQKRNETTGLGTCVIAYSDPITLGWRADPRSDACRLPDDIGIIKTIGRKQETMQL